MASACSHFVGVSSDGRTLEVAGQPFYFCGANCYYLMVSSTLTPVSNFQCNRRTVPPPPPPKQSHSMTHPRTCVL